MTDTAPARRGFLRGLLTLPLIGGGVTLIGNPVGAAEPITSQLLSEYETWLGIEQLRVARETRPGATYVKTQLHGAAADWHGRKGWLMPGMEPASTRAALVLSTVGCDWRR